MSWLASFMLSFLGNNSIFLSDSLSLYLDYIIRFIYFSHTLLYPEYLCFSVCANYKYWKSIPNRDVLWEYQHMFECLGLVESNWVLCKLYLRVLGSLCNGVLSQNYQREIIRTLSLIFVCWQFCSYLSWLRKLCRQWLTLYWIFKVVVDSTEKSQVSLKRFV